VISRAAGPAIGESTASAVCVRPWLLEGGVLIEVAAEVSGVPLAVATPAGTAITVFF
jgi:hypothetical protein